MRKFIFIVLAALSIVACRPSIEGTVTQIDSYGSVHTSFTIEEMFKKGFDYADVVKVEFDTSGTYIMPITTAYSEVGIGKPSYCHYSKRGEASFGYCQGDFHKVFGGNPGEKVKITMYEKQGFSETYQLMQSVYYLDRDEYSSDEVFANFREITTTGMKPNTVYRSGNPLNFKSNPNRCKYVDSLARVNHINTEIDIADTEDDIIAYAQSPEFAGPYCYGLYLAGNTIPLGMGSDTFCERAYSGFARGMRFMISHNPPYLIHCNEGKDRCGFYSMLLESLAGASVDELEDDYMTTYTNLYKMEKGTEAYNLNLSMTGDRLIWLMGHPEDISNPNFDWSTINLNDIDPETTARTFLIKYCGMTTDEVDELTRKISK